jgi:site-specific DNA-adenine methylase
MFLNSFIAWIGGKKLLREEIVKRFPRDKDITTQYVVKSIAIVNYAA